MRRSWATLVICGFGTLFGCGGPRASEGGFDSPDPASKLYAIHRAGEARDSAAIKPLVEQLESDDPAVRMMAIGALQRITGARMGYNPYAPPLDRQAAIERWVQAVRQAGVCGAFHDSEPDESRQGNP